MTGVLRMPSGWMLPQLTPFAVGGLPMLRIHITAPVVSSSAIDVVAGRDGEEHARPPGPFSMYSGEAHMLPVKVPAKPAVRLIVAAAALVSPAG